MKTFCIALLSTLVSLAAAAADLRVSIHAADGKPLADAVVWVDSPASASRPAGSPAEIAQRDQEFEPYVTVVSTGSRVSFPNRDKVKHHVYSFSPAKTFEIQLYSGTPTEPVVFDKAGVVVIGCNIHDWMLAYIVVLDTTAFAKSAANGTATIDNLPPGHYTLHAWHPSQLADAPTQVIDLTTPQTRREVGVTIPVGPSQRKPHHATGDTY